MNTDFRIVVLSDDPYHLGLLKGYCHVHRYKIFETTAHRELLHAMTQMQPNLVILAMGITQNRLSKVDFERVRELAANLQIPVCCLHGINASSLENDMACWIDAILDAPLDLNQLDNYLLIRFKHHHLFIQEKRNRARRAANDRRLLMLEQQDEAGCNKHLVYSTPKTDDADYFIVGAFQIDQRSKCVLLNGKSLNLTRKEFDLFELLAKDVERVFMSDEIINHVWPENNRVTKSDLYQYMHLLRKKVEIDPNNPQWILTIKGFGYKLHVEASTNANPPAFKTMKLINNIAP